MSDKERIEKLIQTLMHLKNCMDIIKGNHEGELLHSDIEHVKRIIELVIQKNADQIHLDL